MRMLLRSVLAIGAWALSASALLVVPHPIETLATIASKGMDIDIVCNDCPFPEIAKNGQVTWKKDVETSVVRLPRWFSMLLKPVKLMRVPPSRSISLPTMTLSISTVSRSSRTRPP